MGRGQRIAKRRKLYIRQRGLCALCGEVMHIDHKDICRERHLMATLDHIERKRDGGSDGYENLRLTHKACNERRN